MDLSALKVGLVRVVAKDGSVWWVSPSSASWYAALPSAKLPSALSKGATS